jgi:hypothetical protein
MLWHYFTSSDICSLGDGFKTAVHVLRYVILCVRIAFENTDEDTLKLRAKFTWPIRNKLTSSVENAQKKILLNFVSEIKSYERLKKKIKAQQNPHCAFISCK